MNQRLRPTIARRLARSAKVRHPGLMSDAFHRLAAVNSLRFFDLLAGKVLQSAPDGTDASVYILGQLDVPTGSERDELIRLARFDLMVASGAYEVIADRKLEPELRPPKMNLSTTSPMSLKIPELSN